MNYHPKLTLALLVLSSSAFPEKDKVQHKDSYVPGWAGEDRLSKEVRHELGMLPNFGVFDDLGFNVNGGTVTLVGAVIRPTLKSEGWILLRN